MANKIRYSLLIMIVSLSLAFTKVQSQDQQVPQSSTADSMAIAIQKDVASLLKANCATAGCHRGAYPKKKLNLEEDKFVAATVNVSSIQNPELKLVDPKNPAKSYLFIKVTGAKGIVDDRMPLEAPILKKADEELILKWITSLQTASAVEKKNLKLINESNDQNRYHHSTFWASQLINLPTSYTIDRHDFLFRISHRFYSTVRSGYETNFGLNGPANIFFSLGYGILDNLSFTAGHSNTGHEFEFTLHWLALQQDEFPVSVAINCGESWITQKEEGKKTFRPENLKFNVQGIIARQIIDKLSLELVPSYSTNTNHWMSDSKGTFALGMGGRYIFYPNLAVMLELLPVLDGYKDKYRGWGTGFEYKAGGHVFQIALTNCYGLTTDQYLPGGDLKIEKKDYRIGFNIFRNL
jgi:hypothetical protein